MRTRNKLILNGILIILFVIVMAGATTCQGPTLAIPKTTMEAEA